jgi:hypothetical protein
MPKIDDRPTGRPTDEEIAKRAYEIYLQRGSLPGYEVDDWLAAEAELMASAAHDSAREESTEGEPAAPAPRGATARRNGARRDATTPSSPSPSRRTLRQ